MRIPVAAALIVLAVLAGCGGGSDAGPSPSPTTPRQNALSQAQYDIRMSAVCREAVRETRGLGRRFLRIGRKLSTSGGLALTTEGLVKPGIRIRERMAARMRELGVPPAPSNALRAYLELFDPIDVLIRARLHAGRAGQLAEASTLEHVAQHIADEQRNDARLAGLNDCNVDFVQVAFSAAGSR